MDSKPCVVIVSSSNTKPKSLIKLITKETPNDGPDVIIHPWQLKTKYYTADINLVGIEENYIRDDEFNSSVEALIIHMDPNKESGLDDLKKWEDFETDCDPEVKLLIANYCNDNTKITKSAVMEWCLKRGFEFVELYPNAIKPEDEEEEIIVEKVGVERVVEALQAHVWPNLTMKGDSSTNAPDGDIGDDILTEDGSDNFTELFNQLHMMKNSIQSLPLRERKQCAEQIVTAFWNAIGGDEEEVSDS